MKTVLKRHWPLLGVSLLLLLVAFYFARSGKELLKTTALLKDMVSGEGLQLNDIHYRQDDPDEKVKWVLDAERVQLSEDKKIIRFYNFALKVEPEGRRGFRLSGQRGIYYKDDGRIELRGDLKGFYDKTYQIFTEHLVISDNLGRVATEEPVKIAGPFFLVEGRGLAADLTQEKITICSDVTTTLKEKPEAL